MNSGVPVISVDTKKKEFVGNFMNGGHEWQPQGEPELVDVHDFPGDVDLADNLDLAIHVSDFPPGTSNCNKSEHRMFSFISLNCRGRLLRSYETMVSLIGNTTDRRGLVVRARLDRR